MKPEWYDAILPPVELEVGKSYDHPTEGRITIIDGCYRDPTYNRISNFWRWRRADGSEGSGYGGHWPEAAK